MKTNKIITGFAIVCMMLQAVYGLPSQRVSASIMLYSGRGTVEWDMTGEEFSELSGRIQKLPPVQLRRIPAEGYVVIKNYGEPSFPYSQVYVFKKGMVIAEAGSEKYSYLDEKGELLNWLLALGNKHDPSYVAPKYQALPEGTAYMAYTPTSFEETVAQGAELKMRLTVFSEGNAPLEGAIETPAYMHVDKGTFKLLAIEGIDDYVFSVDTSQPGEKTGEIIIRTNDPKNSRVRIPFKVSVTGKKEAEEPAEKEGNGSNYFFYLAGLVALAGAAYYVYLTGRPKKA